MTRFNASEARRDFFKILDSVERGEEVIVERQGTRFRLILEKSVDEAQKAPARLTIEDEDVLSGQWTWTADENGQFEFQPRRNQD